VVVALAPPARGEGEDTTRPFLLHTSYDQFLYIRKFPICQAENFSTVHNSSAAGQ